ncbi:hypothetical protein Lalb_Chr01g0009281 [Lupinus albus]|uniref:Uncharacterized protein n=1 Tax=Lupinus albus TaxID=3870 RepID=A0A6A4R6Q1_LUPAL|nr:hypothetical protein Lalb_Chr01g0009281 [Lupinus albus]
MDCILIFKSKLHSHPRVLVKLHKSPLTFLSLHEPPLILYICYTDYPYII